MEPRGHEREERGRPINLRRKHRGERGWEGERRERKGVNGTEDEREGTP